MTLIPKQNQLSRKEAQGGLRVEDTRVMVSEILNLLKTGLKFSFHSKIKLLSSSAQIQLSSVNVRQT